ncbi:MAG TPA: SagB/ThcOx family dehydrogenase, partial [Candidatus Acidoferrum sp.]|nr:SagB/ThcOx family dehydrogenase [Candidatus Acidoferrum sp.]
ETEPLSSFQVEYPAIPAMHAASSILSEEGAAGWRGTGPSGDPLASINPTTPLKPLEGDEVPRDSLTEVILRRGSSRTFAHAPISFAQLSTILDRATRGVPADFLEPQGASLNTLYLIVNAVDDLAPGSYVYHRRERALELLRQGNFRRQAGYLGLEQELPADASVNVYCLARLDPILARFGNRGYRAAQIEGGILGGKLYLGAYAQRLGATGLTFYDDDVTEFFSPNAAGKSVMFLAAIGHPKKRA